MEVLAANGYITGYTGKDGALALPMMPLVRGEISQARCGLPKLNHPHGPFPIMITQVISLIFLPTLQRKAWCFWFGTNEPHRGYEKGVGLRMGKKFSDIDHVPSFWPDNDEHAGTC